MINPDKRYYIVDTAGHYCKLNEQKDLVIARDISEAALFTQIEAETRISKGRKSRFYHVIEAKEDKIPAMAIAPQTMEPSVPQHESVETTTMFDGFHYNWEDMLSDLCYMSKHITEYQKKLHGMQSDVDQEISDILHYLEFTNPDNEELLRASQMLQELRRKRREITDEIEKSKYMCDAFLDKKFGDKVQQVLDRMERMKARQYTPRKLTDLFTQQQKASA